MVYLPLGDALSAAASFSRLGHLVADFELASDLVAELDLLLGAHVWNVWQQFRGRRRRLAASPAAGGEFTGLGTALNARMLAFDELIAPVDVLIGGIVDVGGVADCYLAFGRGVVIQRLAIHDGAARAAPAFVDQCDMIAEDVLLPS